MDVQDSSLTKLAGDVAKGSAGAFNLSIYVCLHYVSWLPYSKVASDRTSHVASQGFRCRYSSEQNASPALESVQDYFHCTELVSRIWL